MTKLSKILARKERIEISNFFIEVTPEMLKPFLCRLLMKMSFKNHKEQQESA